MNLPLRSLAIGGANAAKNGNTEAQERTLEVLRRILTTEKLRKSDLAILTRVIALLVKGVTTRLSPDEIKEFEEISPKLSERPVDPNSKGPAKRTFNREIVQVNAVNHTGRFFGAGPTR